MAKYLCSVCGFVYDEEKEGKKWEDLPDDWVCPVCDSDKSYFRPLEAQEPAAPPAPGKETRPGKRICSVCGYLIKEGFPGEVCPACGVPKTAFQPYVDKMSPQRRKILDLHMHNILVHFPQAFSLLMLFLIFMSFIISGTLQFEFLVTAQILAFFLPVSVLVSLFSGIIDAKNRFKRTDTPVLKKKITAGVLFLVFSIGVFFLFYFTSLDGSALQWLLLVLTALCAGCSLFLGYNGGRLSHAEVPG